MYKISLIGFGFINRALAHGFGHHVEMKIYDKYDNHYDALEETVNFSDFIFIGVPTPMSDEGHQDLSNMDDAIQSVVDVANTSKIIIIRSTVIPGTTRKYAEKYQDHTFVFIPEFLTERRANLEFINATRTILGGEKFAINLVEGLYRTRFSHMSIFKTTWEGAEISKYMANCFYAVKVAFMNEMYDVADEFGLKYDDLKGMLLASGWVNPMHTDVPGHDGDRGYGGKCYPKDMQAFIKWSEKNKLHTDMCKAAEKVNARVRSNKDWLDIKGATSKNNYEDTKGDK